MRLFLSRIFDMDLLFFVFNSVVITIVFEMLPEKHFDYRKTPYCTRRWERSGEIYNRIFKVKKWKGAVLELSDIIKSVFPKKHLTDHSKEYLNMYLVQSCRSEGAHTTIIISTAIFIYSEGLSVFADMFVLAVFLNLPYIIIQRYNRPRIIKHIKHLDDPVCSRLVV